MKLYLSSYKIGKEVEMLKILTSKNKRTALIPNALDFATDLEKRSKSLQSDIDELQAAGLEPELLDLRDYFGKTEELKKKIEHFWLIWARGGNTFNLRMAMKLSWMDTILTELHDSNADIVYGGYSAWICVLSPTLYGIHLADEPASQPYGTEHENLREWLDIIDYFIAPHYRSDHFESPLIEKVVDYYIEHKMLFIALHDGEVIIE